MLQEIQVGRGGKKMTPSVGGGVWIFSGIIQYTTALINF